MDCSCGHGGEFPPSLRPGAGRFGHQPGRGRGLGAAPQIQRGDPPVGDQFHPGPQCGEVRQPVPAVLHDHRQRGGNVRHPGAAADLYRLRGRQVCHRGRLLRVPRNGGRSSREQFNAHYAAGILRGPVCCVRGTRHAGWHRCRAPRHQLPIHRGGGAGGGQFCQRRHSCDPGRSIRRTL